MVRTIVLSACLLASALYLSRATTSDAVPIKKPFSEFPMRLASFQGAPNEPIEDKVLAVLGVDDYLNRVYRTAAGTPIGLYVGYYESQREGDTIHSPMNCLPGSGWVPAKTGRTTIAMGSAPIEINRYVVQKGAESMLVLYWYQSQGHVIASEYASKINMVMNAMRTNRTDAALVRVIVPIGNTGTNTEDKAEELGVDFVRAMFPQLANHLPA